MIRECLGFDPYNMAVTGGVSKTMTNIATDSDHIPVVCVQYCGDKTDATYSTDKAYCIPKNPVSDRQQAVCIPTKKRGVINGDTA